MARSTRTGLAKTAPLVMVVVVGGAALWWLTGSGEFVLERGGRSVLIGLAVGFVVTVVSLGKPAVKALAKNAPWSSRDYLVPGELPPPPVFFVGREALLNEVATLIRDAPKRRRGRAFVLLVQGEPGVGKSGFALKAAASAAGQFVDGVVYLSMTDARLGTPRVHNVLGDLVDTLQGPRDKVPLTWEERLKAYRKLSRRKGRVLYVFDDVVDERVLELVRPFSSRAAVIVTTREPMLGVKADERRALTPLSIPEATGLLHSLLEVRDPDDVTAQAIQRVAVATAGFPLALHLAVVAISSRGLWALGELTSGLPDRPEDVDPQDAPTLMLELSIRVLSDVQRRTLLSLAWMPEPTFVPWMVQAVADLRAASDQQAENDAWRICDRLADLRLLERIAPDAVGVVRLRLPDRVKEFIAVRAAESFPPGEVERALARLDGLRHRRRIPAVEDILDTLNRGEAAKALDEARGALSDAVGADPLGAARILEGAGREALAVLAEVLAEMGGLDDAIEIATAQDRAREEHAHATVPRDVAEVRLRRCLGKLQRRAGDVKKAIASLESACRLAAALDDVEQQILILREIAIAQSTLRGRGSGAKQADQTLNDAWSTLEGSGRTAFSDAYAGYLESRLIEARVMVLLNESDGPKVADDVFRGALASLDRAIDLLPADYLLWRSWLTFQRTRVLVRWAETATQRASGQSEADDGEILSGLDLARRLRREARLTAEEALEGFAKMSHRFGIARCRLEIGRSYVREGDADTAIPLLEEARETFFFSGDRWVEARTALELADIRVRAGGSRAAATAELQFAERVFRGVHDRDSLRKVRRVRRELRARKGS